MQVKTQSKVTPKKRKHSNHLEWLEYIKQELKKSRLNENIII